MEYLCKIFGLPQKNSLSLRTFLAMILIMARGCVWVLEQPSSSIVFRHPRFQALLQLTTVPHLPKGLNNCLIYISSIHIYIYIHFFLWYIYNSGNSGSIVCLYIYDFDTFKSFNLKDRFPIYTIETSKSQVFKQAFWMRAWGSKTPKRTVLWSNSKAISLFATTAKHYRINKKVKLATTYHDSSGRKRYKGNRHMKGSQS